MVYLLIYLSYFSFPHHQSVKYTPNPHPFRVSSYTSYASLFTGRHHRPSRRKTIYHIIDRVPVVISKSIDSSIGTVSSPSTPGTGLSYFVSPQTCLSPSSRFPQYRYHHRFFEFYYCFFFGYEDSIRIIRGP